MHDLMLESSKAAVGKLLVTSPCDGREIGQVATAGPDHVADAMAAGYVLFRNKKEWLSIPQRLAILNKTTDIMRGQIDELALLAASEGGKPLVDSRAEVVRAIDGIHLCAESLRTHAGSIIPIGTTPATSGRLAFTQKEPIGVVVAPESADTEVGPLIRPAEVNRVADWVGAAVTAGEKLLCGGKKISDTCYAPTVLLNPPAVARVTNSEIFGPVVCVYDYHEIDDAVQRANSLPVAFQAAIFCSEIDTAMRLYKTLDASAVMVNDHTAFRDDVIPFAGLRESGLGVGGIPYTMEDMQIDKMLVIKSAAL